MINDQCLTVDIYCLLFFTYGYINSKNKINSLDVEKRRSELLTNLFIVIRVYKEMRRVTKLSNDPLNWIKRILGKHLWQIHCFLPSKWDLQLKNDFSPQKEASFVEEYTLSWRSTVIKGSRTWIPKTVSLWKTNVAKPCMIHFQRRDLHLKTLTM